MITRAVLAEKLTDYLQHRLGLNDLIDWAEDAMMDGVFDPADFEVIRDVTARLGLADVRAFNLSWRDCEEMLNQLGYQARIEVVAA